jgi:hypothetical protein
VCRLYAHQDWGCRQLALVGDKYKTDREVLTAFTAFQTACMATMKKAALKRAELKRDKEP